jgi:pimeloyl-ACP methyl ester carboxylesterase
LSRPAAAAPRALPVDPVFVDGPAGRLALYAAGRGAAAAVASPPPLLLVHSVNAAASAAEVRPLFEVFAATRPVLALDLPGFGESDRSDRAYTPRLMTDAVHEAAAWAAARWGVPALDALAVSLGCEFLARAAVERPARFRRLALVSPTGFRGTQARRGPAAAPLGPPWLLRALNGAWGPALFRGLTRPAVIRYFLRRTWGSDGIDETLWAYDVHATRQPGAHHAPLHFLAAALFSRDVNTLYEALAQPVWASHGTRGDFTDYRLLPATVGGRPNWRVQVWRDCGALPYFERPAEFAAALAAFLDG